MAIEAGARAGMIAADDVTFSYLEGRAGVPKGDAWHQAVEKWRYFASDPDATFDRTVTLDASQVRPMLTYGTNPAMAIPLDGTIPADTTGGMHAKALAYMQFHAGESLLGKPVDVVFIGSCTNSRISDLRQAADVFRGRRVAPTTRTLVVPGSRWVKEQAEREGLDRIFLDAGAEWREPSCSMCIAMNGDQLKPGELAISTSNRNFEGRQGPGGRTLLASPITAAWAAVAGRVQAQTTQIPKEFLV
jgi:3-isopropylmalate/(R)-2-methylmalate dehydratase large subunit